MKQEITTVRLHLLENLTTSLLLHFDFSADGYYVRESRMTSSVNRCGMFAIVRLSV